MVRYIVTKQEEWQSRYYMLASGGVRGSVKGWRNVSEPSLSEVLGVSQEVSAALQWGVGRVGLSHGAMCNDFFLPSSSASLSSSFSSPPGMWLVDSFPRSVVCVWC